MIVCSNGKFIEESELLLDVRTNRAFRYGDGFFETIRFEQNRIPLFKYHLQRMEVSNNLFKFEPSTLSFSEIENLIGQTFQLNKIESGIARVTFFRSGEGRYTPLRNEMHFLIEVTEQSFGSYFSLLKEVGLSTQTVLHAHAFSHLKTLNALPYVFAAMEAKENEWNECLLPNTKNEIAEGTWSSLVWLVEDQLFTPPLSSGCVDSTLKNALKEMLQTQGKVLKEKACQLSNLQQAQEVWLLNATRGIQAVSHFQDKIYSHNMALKVASELEDFLSL
jgi:branched-subunit amino acid aminotransferase/4-amino-4-deoxychorismate lyase